MLKSRVIAFLLVVSMLITGVGMTIVPVSAVDEGDITIAIGSVTAKPGDKVGLPITISNNGPDAGNAPVGGINMYIVCPDGIEQVAYRNNSEIQNGPMINQWMMLTDYSMTRTVSSMGTNPFCLFLEAATSYYPMEGDGVIATFYYQIPEDAPAGDYVVEFSFSNEKDELGGVTYSRVYQWSEGVTEGEEGDATNVEEITAINWVSGVITVEAAETQPTECTHEWSDWAYDEDNLPTCGDAGQQIRSCSKCGETETEPVAALGHDWQGLIDEIPADCLNEGTIAYEPCGRCGQLRNAGGDEISADDLTIPALGHDLGEFVSNGDATCETDGTKTAECSRCDYSETVTDAGSREDVEHSFREPVSNGDATCTADGTWTYTCAVCGEEKVETEPGSALGHSYGEWYEYKAPTLEAQGEKRRDCQREGCDHYESEAIPALKHEYTAVYTEPTCEADGYTTYTCSKAECPHSYVVTDEGSKLRHDHHSVGFDAPTCTSDGTDYYACERCGDSYSVPVPALGHDMGEYVSDNNAGCETDGTKTSSCSRCDHTDTVTDEGSKLGHDLTGWQTVLAPQCGVEGLKENQCSRCDYLESEAIPALEHAFTEFVSDGNATCHTDGTKTAKCDNGCGETYTVADNDSMLPHSYGQWEVYKAPTLEAEGEERRYCADCNAYESRAIPALQHEYTAVYTDPTCTEDGYTTYTCSKAECPHSYVVTDEGSALGHEMGEWILDRAPGCRNDGYKISSCSRCDYTETEVVPATGHESDSYVEVEATCTKDGLEVTVCVQCLSRLEEKVIPALGHDLGEWKSNHDATCEADGTKTAKCSRCSHTETAADEGSALGHNYESVVTEPTCEAGGYTTHTCARCGHTYTDAETEALGHEYSRENVTKQPTCTAEGEKTFTCERCDKFVTEAIPALGHDLGEWVSNNDATCEADGTKTAQCSRCDHSETVTDLGSALGHDYDSVVTEPTCTAGGYTTHTCSRCDDTYTDAETEALGHEYSRENVTIEPTCETAGEKTFTCERCDEFITEEIPALGHDYEVVTVEPTCETAGSKTSTCSRCDDVIVEELAALGHSFTEYVSNGDATCKTDGTKTAKCDRCDATNTTVDEGSALGHEIVEHAAVPATCLAEGSIAYTECTRCGKLWNTAGEEITLADTVTPKLAEMEGTTAVVNPETVQTQADGSTVIDLTNAGTQVDKIVVPAESVAAAEGPVIIAAPDAMVYIPAEAIAGIEANIEVALAAVSEDALTEAQKAALDNVIFLEGVSIEVNVPVTEDSQVAVPFELPKGHKASNIEVWSVSETGEVVKLKTELPDGFLVFDAVEGGQYMIISTRTNGSPDMGDSTNLIVLIVALLASLAGIVVAIINRKKLSRK